MKKKTIPITEQNINMIHEHTGWSHVSIREMLEVSPNGLYLRMTAPWVELGDE